MTTKGKGLLKKAQAAKALGITSDEVRDMVESGQIQADYAPGNHGYRIPVEEIDRIRSEENQQRRSS